MNKLFQEKRTNIEKLVCVLFSKEEVKYYLQDVLRYQPKIIAFNYQTTGPEPKGNRILCVSICWQNNKSTAWSWEYTDIDLYRKVMQNPDIGKVSFESLFEEEWTNYRVRRTTIQGWKYEMQIQRDSRYPSEVDDKLLLQCGKDNLSEYQILVKEMIKKGRIK